MSKQYFQNNGLKEMMRDGDGRALGIMCGEEEQKRKQKNFQEMKERQKEFLVRYR